MEKLGWEVKQTQCEFKSELYQVEPPFTWYCLSGGVHLLFPRVLGIVTLPWTT